MPLESRAPHRANNGRPVRQLTPRVIESIGVLVRHGVPLTAAARALEIPERSLHNWLRWAADDGPNAELFDDLRDAVASAQAERERTVAELIERARRHARGTAVRRQATRH